MVLPITIRLWRDRAEVRARLLVRERGGVSNVDETHDFVWTDTAADAQRHRGKFCHGRLPSALKFARPADMGSTGAQRSAALPHGTAPAPHGYNEPMPNSDPVKPSSSGLKLTYDDFLLFPDDGKRHELIDGEHYVTPSPNARH
jgi:hypothetical protein